jgi:hypothetical protein
LPVDGRADQYSLACMAFALLTGNLPFRRQETMATLFAHMNDPVPPLSRYRGDLPPGTDAVLARGLAKEPQDRYARCGEFAAALRDTLAGPRHSATAGGWAGSGSPSLPAPAPTRLESGPRASRPPNVPETAVWPGTVSQAPPAAAAAAQQTWAAGPVPGADQPTPVFPGPVARGAAPGAPPPFGGRPVTRPAPPPPPAAGQGGKLPFVSRSAVIAALAAAAALLLLLLLHGYG